MTAAVVAAVALALVHVGGGRLYRLDTVPRHVLLSAGSGVSVAYVFVHLLPELAEAQAHVAESNLTGVWASVERHAWLAALLGLLVFYGLELLARRHADTGRRGQPDLVGGLHLASYGVYNTIVGYLLVERAEQSLATLVLFTVAMAVHFLVNDHGLRAHHDALYRRWGRWLVAAGAVLGSAIGMVTRLSPAGLGLLVAFLAGGIVMNVMKEELPQTRRSRWGPLAGGAVVYAMLLIAI